MHKQLERSYIFDGAGAVAICHVRSRQTTKLTPAIIRKMLGLCGDVHFYILGSTRALGESNRSLRRIAILCCDTLRSSGMLLVLALDPGCPPAWSDESSSPSHAHTANLSPKHTVLSPDSAQKPSTKNESLNSKTTGSPNLRLNQVDVDASIPDTRPGRHSSGFRTRFCDKKRQRVWLGVRPSGLLLDRCSSNTWALI